MLKFIAKLKNIIICHWDPDFTKLTSAEEERLDAALQDSESVTFDELLAELN